MIILINEVIYMLKKLNLFFSMILILNLSSTVMASSIDEDNVLNTFSWRDVYNYDNYIKDINKEKFENDEHIVNQINPDLLTDDPIIVVIKNKYSEAGKEWTTNDLSLSDNNIDYIRDITPVDDYYIEYKPTVYHQYLNIELKKLSKENTIEVIQALEANDNVLFVDTVTATMVLNKKGDINYDGKVDITDLTEISLSLLGDKEFSETQQQTADVDGDGTVTLADLARVRQFLSKQISSLE